MVPLASRGAVASSMAWRQSRAPASMEMTSSVSNWVSMAVSGLDRMAPI